MTKSLFDRAVAVMAYAVREAEWSEGFDRNGSHSTGEYVEHITSLATYFNEDLEQFICKVLAEEALRALLAELPKLGVKLVPVEATSRMLGAVYEQLTSSSTSSQLISAIIAAAPNPLAEDE